MINFSDQFKDAEPTQADLLLAIADMIQRNRNAVLQFLTDNPTDGYKLRQAGYVFLGGDMDGEVMDCLATAAARAKQDGWSAILEPNAAPQKPEIVWGEQC